MYECRVEWLTFSRQLNKRKYNSQYLPLSIPSKYGTSRSCSSQSLESIVGLFRNFKIFIHFSNVSSCFGKKYLGSSCYFQQKHLYFPTILIYLKIQQYLKHYNQLLVEILYLNTLQFKFLKLISITCHTKKSIQIFLKHHLQLWHALQLSLNLKQTTVYSLSELKCF